MMTDYDRRIAAAGPSAELSSAPMPNIETPNIEAVDTPSLSVAELAGAIDSRCEPVSMPHRQLDTSATALELNALAKRFGTPLLVLDPDILARSYTQLREALPGVDLHFAVKAFPNPSAIRVLESLGSSFDVASVGELNIVSDLGVGAHRVLFTHPIKRVEDIERALNFGCTSFVADNAHELLKLKAFSSQIDVIIRVSFPNREARVDLSRKFGCAPQEALELLSQARALGLNVRGLAFNVGSQVASADAYVRAIAWCKQTIEAARAEHDISLVDIGGGFPADYDGDLGSLVDFCAPIREALQELPEHIEVIAEPGRCLTAAAVTGVTSVVGKAWRQGRLWYYLDDGLYGSYSGQVYDNAGYRFVALKSAETEIPSVLAGPTCDSFDMLAEDVLLPELEVGDLLVSPMMGAYTCASASDFNSLNRARVVSLSVLRVGAGKSRRAAQSTPALRAVADVG